MRASDPGESPRESGVTRKSSPGAYAVLRPEVSATALTAEQRIAGIKAYHEARVRLAVLAEELSTAPAGDIIPGVTAAYVEAMRLCLQTLVRNADIAEGL